jgi:sodium transport system ATP-binding protein
MDPVVVRGLAKTFYEEARGEVQAVRGIDFECRAGEIFGLLGANGAGKTTTLRMLSTILAPTAGTAHVLGPDVSRRVDYLIERFGIERYANARIERLSSGMKQKVSIARTVAHDPPLLIFDEPTVGLDVLNAIEMQDVIREFRDHGKTILFSTHIMSEAEKICGRIAIIHNGVILDCGTLEYLRTATGQHYLEDIFVHYVRSRE